jgi:hypothetical protein
VRPFTPFTAALRRVERRTCSVSGAPYGSGARLWTLGSARGQQTPATSVRRLLRVGRRFCPSTTGRTSLRATGPATVNSGRSAGRNRAEANARLIAAASFAVSDGSPRWTHPIPSSGTCGRSSAGSDPSARVGRSSASPRRRRSARSAPALRRRGRARRTAPCHPRGRCGRRGAAARRAGRRGCTAG